MADNWFLELLTNILVSFVFTLVQTQTETTLAIENSCGTPLCSLLEGKRASGLLPGIGIICSL